MAMMRTSTALVVNPKVTAPNWANRTAKRGKVVSSKDVLTKFDPRNWLLSHVSIVASVDTDFADAKDKKSDYLIKPTHSIFVNNNGDCWDREMLKASYKTFMGANSYVEHVQIVSLAKGKVVDVALREVDLGKDPETGAPISTLYVDILIANDRKHVDLCHKIETGEYNAVSMGCLIEYSRCSRCGNIAKDESEQCQHVRFEKNNYYYDSTGVRRIVAELCGSADKPDSVKFIDASWVKQPAFVGAVLRNIVSPPIHAFNKPMKDQLMEVLSKQDILTDEHHTIARQASVLSKESTTLEEVIAGEGETPADIPDPPKDDAVDDAAFPEAPDDTTPAEEGTPPATDEGEAPEEPTKVDPETVKTPIKDIKDDLKDTLLNQIKQELVDQTKKMLPQEDYLGRGGAPSARLENDVNQSLIREATSAENVHKLWNKYSIDIHTVPNKKLAAALMMMSRLSSISDMKKFGYNSRDMLGMLFYMDQRLGSNSLPVESVEFLTDVNNRVANTKQEFISDYIISVGKKITAKQASKLWSWVNILKEF